MKARRSFYCVVILEKDSTDENFEFPTASDLYTLLAAKGIEVLAQPRDSDGPVVLKFTEEKPHGL